MRGEAWSDDDLRLLKKLWAAGETAETIARTLGDMSRSAVLGKVFRLRLPPGAAAKTSEERATERAKVRPVKGVPARRRGVTPGLPIEPGAERKGRTLFELTNDCCRWPYRRPGAEHYFFCAAAGADLESGVPYCPRHMKRAYLVPPPRVTAGRRAVLPPERRKRAGAPWR
jgi:GcrA cell cycle regulator